MQPTPLALTAGVNSSLPAMMSATLMDCPALTAIPLSINEPAVGSVAMYTASKLSGGVSLGR